MRVRTTVGHSEIGEHLAEEGGDRLGGTVNHCDLLGCDAFVQERPDLTRDEFKLGTRAAPLEQPDSPPGIDAGATADEQRTLQVV